MPSVVVIRGTLFAITDSSGAATSEYVAGQTYTVTVGLNQGQDLHYSHLSLCMNLSLPDMNSDILPTDA